MKFSHPIAIEELAQKLQAKIICRGADLVLGMNEIHNVETGDLTFVDHPKYYDFTLKSAADFILINKEVDAVDGKTLLYHPNPFDAYNELSKSFLPNYFSSLNIHPSAKIGTGTVIYPTAYIGENVEIGNDCIVYPNAVVYAKSKLGNEVIVHASAVIGADAFYYKRKENGYEKMYSIGRTVLCDRVEIGAGSTIDAGVSSDTIIGTGTKIDDQVHIGHDVKIGEHCILCGQVGIAGNTKVGNRVTLYGKVAVNKNIEIGDDVVVMASASVPKSLAAGKTYMGEPADEMRIVAKQFAIIRQLPDLWEKLRKL